jgi:hypothetical protein
MQAKWLRVGHCKCTKLRICLEKGVITKYAILGQVQVTVLWRVGRG